MREQAVLTDGERDFLKVVCEGSEMHGEWETDGSGHLMRFVKRMDYMLYGGLIVYNRETKDCSLFAFMPIKVIVNMGGKAP